MAIKVANYPLTHFDSLRKSNTMRISPEIQRRAVWDEKTKMLFVDSLARQVPVGAITLYACDHPDGYVVWEVIDGKQRLGALFAFMDGHFVVNEGVITKVEDDELASVGAELAAPVYEKLYSDLEPKVTNRLLQYQIPVFEVSGSRDQAVQAFTRMNRNSYVLKPQEIRNAVYAESAFLRAAESVSEKFNLNFTDQNQPGLVTLGAMTQAGWDRMQDIQFCSELLALAIDGEQHRRDSLNAFYDKYSSPGSAAKKQLESAESTVLEALKQIVEIFEESPLKSAHFPASCENDVYALVGALLKRGTFTKPQMHQLQTALKETITEFRRQVVLFIEASRATDGSGAAFLEAAPEVVGAYAKTFLGGQQNSDGRRVTRREALVALLDSVAAAPSGKAFSATTRQLIWARSVDKLCGRCGDVVAYLDFHAGHIIPAAKGGSPTVNNGRVEHSACNLAAGAAS